MHAVILTGGKQYRVTEGDVLSVEKVEGGSGQRVHFDRILLVEDGDTILVGTPELAQALVRAEVVETYKDEKVLVFKKKRRKQFRRTRGHRQVLTKVRIEKIIPDKTAVPADELRLAQPAPAREEAPEAKTEAKGPSAAKKVAEKAAKPKKSVAAKTAPKAKPVPKKPATAKKKSKE